MIREFRVAASTFGASIVLSVALWHVLRASTASAVSLAVGLLFVLAASVSLLSGLVLASFAWRWPAWVLDAQFVPPAQAPLWPVVPAHGHVSGDRSPSATPVEEPELVRRRSAVVSVEQPYEPPSRYIRLPEPPPNPATRLPTSSPTLVDIPTVAAAGPVPDATTRARRAAPYDSAKDWADLPAAGPNTPWFPPFTSAPARYGQDVEQTARQASADAASVPSR